MTALIARLLKQNTVTVSGTVQPGHNSYNATSGNLTATLPAITGGGAVATLVAAGKVVRVKVSKSKADSSANTVTVACAGTETFEGGGTSFALAVPGEKLVLSAETLPGASGPVWVVEDHSAPRDSLDLRYVNGRYTSNGTVSPNIILGDPTAASAAIASDVTGGVMLEPGGVGYNNIIGGDGSATVGTTTPNTSSTGTGANQSLIGGYDNVAGALSSKIISDHSYVGTDATTGHNCIYGGSNNKIHGAGVNRAGIFAGYLCDVSGSFSVATGTSNTVSGSSSLAVGDHNTVSGTGSVASGTTNTASGAYSQAHGSNSTASGSYSQAHGQYALARRYGQHAFSSGHVATAGDVQTSFHTVFGTTTDATPTTLGVDGGATYNSNHQMLRGQTVMVTATITGRSSGGTVQVGFVVKGLAHWESAGNSAIIGVPSLEAFGTIPSGCTATLYSASPGSVVGQLAVQVTGVAATTIQWSAKVDLVESLLA